MDKDHTFTSESDPRRENIELALDLLPTRLHSSIDS